MGLFSRKKDMPFPSKPGKKIEQADFDKLMAEVPQPPRDFPGSALPMPIMTSSAEAQMPQMELPPFSSSDEPQIPPLPSNFKAQMTLPDSQSAMPMQNAMQKELPAFDVNQEISQAPTQQPAQQIKEEFELPDFDDKEMKELENAKIFEAEPEQEPEPEPERETEIKIEEKEKRKIKDMKDIEEISYPEAEKPKKEIEMKTRFMDLNSYSRIREELEEMMNSADHTEELIEQHAATSKAKSDKYNALAESLNLIQDKIMLIDTKLFEGQEQNA